VSTTRLLSNTLVLGLSLTLCSTTASVAATATTDPVGYNTISLLANSDTYVSVPFHRPASFVGQVSSSASNVITVAGTPGWTASQFVYASGTQANTYYAFIRSGTKEGNYYTVTANSANTLTIDLAGDTLTGLAANDSISVIPYWTLGTLFPSTDVGVSFTTSSIATINTSVIVPNLNGAGTNLSAGATYFYFNNAWRVVGQSFAINKNDDILLPDTYFIVRNTNSATAGTFTSTGSVPMKKAVVVLNTNGNGQQDNPVAITRPVAVSLADSGLVTSGAFGITPNWLSPTDTLLVFDNTVSAINKSASGTYYYYNNGWRKIGSAPTVDFGTTPIFGPGNGVIVRKATVVGASPSIWTNSPTY